MIQIENFQNYISEKILTKHIDNIEFFVIIILTSGITPAQISVDPQTDETLITLKKESDSLKESIPTAKYERFDNLLKDSKVTILVATLFAVFLSILGIKEANDKEAIRYHNLIKMFFFLASVIILVSVFMIDLIEQNSYIEQQSSLIGTLGLVLYSKKVANTIKNISQQIQNDSSDIDNFKEEIVSYTSALSQLLTKEILTASQSQIDSWISSLQDLTNKINSQVEIIQNANTAIKGYENDITAQKTKIQILKQQVDIFISSLQTIKKEKQTLPNEVFKVMVDELLSKIGLFSFVDTSNVINGDFSKKAKYSSLFTIVGEFCEAQQNTSLGYSALTTDPATGQTTGIKTNGILQRNVSPYKEIILANLSEKNGNMNQKALDMFRSNKIANPFFHTIIFSDGKICDRFGQDLSLNPKEVIDIPNKVKITKYTNGIEVEFVNDSVASLGVRLVRDNSLYGIGYCREKGNIVNVFAFDQDVFIFPRKFSFVRTDFGLIDPATNAINDNPVFNLIDHTNENGANQQIVTGFPSLTKSNFGTSPLISAWRFSSLSVSSFACQAEKTDLTIRVSTNGASSTGQKVTCGCNNLTTLITFGTTVLFINFHEDGSTCLIFEQSPAGSLILSRKIEE